MNSDFMTSIANFFNGGGLIIIMMVVLMLVMIIPQRKRDKKIKQMLAAIKTGDRVRTIGGIYGTVTNVKDDVITISVGPDRVQLVFARPDPQRHRLPGEAARLRSRRHHQGLRKPAFKCKPKRRGFSAPLLKQSKIKPGCKDQPGLFFNVVNFPL